MLTRRELLKLSFLAVTPQLEEPVETPVAELTNAELYEIIVQFAILSRTNVHHLFMLLNLTRARDMNIGTIKWDGTVYQEPEEAETLT